MVGAVVSLIMIPRVETLHSKLNIMNVTFRVYARWPSSSSGSVHSSSSGSVLSHTGVAYTSECFPCKAGTYAPEPGASRCAPCAANAYSRKGATVCQECEKEKYAGM